MGRLVRYSKAVLRQGEPSHWLFGQNLADLIIAALTVLGDTTAVEIAEFLNDPDCNNKDVWQAAELLRRRKIVRRGARSISLDPAHPMADEIAVLGAAFAVQQNWTPKTPILEGEAVAPYPLDDVTKRVFLTRLRTDLIVLCALGRWISAYEAALLLGYYQPPVHMTATRLIEAGIFRAKPVASAYPFALNPAHWAYTGLERFAVAYDRASGGLYTRILAGRKSKRIPDLRS